VPVLVLLCVPGSEYSLNILSLWIYSLRTNVVANSDSLLSTTNNFTTYLSAYSVFLSSIDGVMISDYYLVRKGRSFIILSHPFLTTPGYLHYPLSSISNNPRISSNQRTLFSKANRSLLLYRRLQSSWLYRISCWYSNKHGWVCRCHWETSPDRRYPHIRS
jgi:purine-cytosine permease-like protein